MARDGPSTSRISSHPGSLSGIETDLGPLGASQGGGAGSNAGAGHGTTTSLGASSVASSVGSSGWGSDLGAPRLDDDDAGPGRQALRLTVTALAYFVVGWLALQVAVAPPYAAPLFPSAGLALAAALVWRRVGLAGVFLGSSLVNLSLGDPFGLDPITSAVIAIGIALGAVLQAAIGAAAVRRWMRQPITLTDPPDIARFYLIGVLSCGVSASIATCLLWMTGALDPGSAQPTLVTWWSGDAIGVLIGAPIALTLIGRPRSVWVGRRGTVGLALALATVVMTFAVLQADRWSHDRNRREFDLQAQSALEALRNRIDDLGQITEAVASVYATGAPVPAGALQRLAVSWLRIPGTLESVAWLERTSAGNGEGAWTPMAWAPAELAAARVPPPDERSDEARSALQRALAANAVVSRIVQPAPDSAPAGPRLELLRAVRVAGAGGVRGLVHTRSELEPLLRPLARELPVGSAVCLREGASTGGRGQVVFEQAGGCDAEARGSAHVRPFQGAIAASGLDWQLTARPPLRPAVSVAGQINIWLLSMIGLIATAMFGALMLTVTGRSQRIAEAVRSRTAQLEAQMRERNRTELALRDSEQRFRNILNTVPIGVLYADLNGHVRQANPRLCEMLGHSSEEMVGLRMQDFTEPADWRVEAEELGRLIRGETPGYRLRKRLVAKDGRRIWVQSVVSALRDETGESRRLVGVAEDITEQLRLAEAERARETAEAANQAKSDFLSRMSHELRTPLNAMLGFAQLLEMDQRHPLAPAQRPWVGQIQQAGWHLLEMINDVLDLSRIEAGTMRLQTQDIDLSEQVVASVALVQQEAERRSLTLHRQLDRTSRRARGDATRVRQILTNLLSNAVKYNVDGGSVRILSRDLGERGLIELVVADTGLGMTPEQLGQLFQPFNRLGRERTAREGTGIGLVISQRLAELMGGSLTARSVAGQGSAFMLRLPASTGTEPDSLPSALEPEEAFDYHRRRVLYIEDNATNIEVMRGILAQRPQILLRVEMTGLGGLAALSEEPVDLLLLDLHLPDIEGLEVLQRLRANPRTAHIPVVAVSADAMGDQIEATLAAGAQQYLTKPVSVSELLRVVDQVLDAADTGFG